MTTRNLRFVYFLDLGCLCFVLFLPNEVFADGTRTALVSLSGKVELGSKVGSVNVSSQIKKIVNTSARNVSGQGVVSGTIQCLGDGTKTIVGKYTPFGIIGSYYNIIIECTYIY